MLELGQFEGENGLELLLEMGKPLRGPENSQETRAAVLNLTRLLLRVRDRSGNNVQLVPNRAQLEFERRRGQSNIVLKARQMGISTWVSARLFLKTATQPGTLTVQVAHTTNGVAAAPVILHSGTISTLPSVAPMVLIDSINLQCSIASFEISQQGPVWVMSTPPGGSAIVRRLGTTAQGSDCKIERTGKLRFYPTSIPQAGELIAISYRTTHRAVARLANAASITQESNGGLLPGTAAWIGTVTSPAPRSSLDCENAATALLDLSTNRGAAWQGKYMAWNMETQGDVWPGDVLAVASTSANLNANLVVRTVELELSCGWPGVVKYVVSFANDWADALAIKTSKTVPAEVWLPQEPESTAPLANLSGLTISSITGSTITVNAVAVPPTNGGFEVRRRDWAFGPGTDSDLVLRSPVNNFTIPRESATEQYYIRMYDASTPPNYSRFSSAVFANVAL